MKKNLLFASILLAATANSQEVVSVQAGYTNQAYYSLNNGEISNIVNNDWDLAFETGAFNTGIRINGTLDWSVYTASNDTTDWANLDTAGFSTWTPLHNSDLSWSEGAFNQANDPNNPYDIGWGIYNPTSHAITGDKIFVLEASNGDIKKLWIKNLVNGTIKIQVADLDNNNLVNQSIIKGNYSDKNLVYYAIASNTVIDREPLATDWDLVFTKYIGEIAPDTYYAVTGVLTNPYTSLYEANGDLASNLTYNNAIPFNTEINTIGYDWKSYSFSAGGYVLDDSLVFFIESQNGDVFKLVFTGFGGSSTGDFEFTLTQIGAASIASTPAANALNIYPNPAIDILHIENANNIQSISILNMNGQIVRDQNIQNQSIIQFDINNLPNGIYVLKATQTDGSIYNSKFIKK
ncbi:T9SS type A sorting domain-containing protein [Putridiphycobacter roseus]|nr:T9SS type A sorting domain-containing protein [Putridiphycobacter roseus]